MMTIITGTPGCGKTTLSKKIADKIDCKLISINSLLEDYNLNLGTDELRGYKIVDIDSMIEIVDKIKEENNDKTIIFEGHLAQDYPNADKVIVLRCNPETLKERLNTRDWSDKKIDENVSAEILGVCTQESYETYGDIVEEIETSNESIDTLTEMIIESIKNNKKYPLGEIDYLEKYFYMLN